MKRIIIIALLLIGCGEPQRVDIKYHEVHYQTLQEICKDKSPCSGYAWWYELDNVTTCHIFMLPEQSYMGLYQEVLDHETRHCYEGHFH